MNKLTNLFIRYIIILVTGLGNLWLFYTVLTPLTIYMLYLLLSIVTSTTILGNTLMTSFITIELIPACVAGSAFYLLFILNLSTPQIKTKKRINILLFTFASLFVLNILRISILISTSNTIYFNTLHWIFWHILSTIFVFVIWLLTIKIYKIKNIPIYSDAKHLIKLTKKHKK